MNMFNKIVKIINTIFKRNKKENIVDNKVKEINLLDRIVDYNIKKYKLTPLEVTVFRELLTDKPNKEIAYDICKSIHTVKKYSHTIYEKLGIEKDCHKKSRVVFMSRVFRALSE